eukprot:c15097_g1_i2 orf=337-1896(-)
MMLFFVEKPDAGLKRSRWPELALRWIPVDGHLFMWDRFPFCPPSWRTAALTAKASGSSSLIHHDQASELEQICKDHHVTLIEDSNAMSSGAIMAADSNFSESNLQGAEEHEVVDKDVLQVVLKANVMMDVRVWSALPEDIIEKVLAWLPLTSVLRFRAVCRRWNSVLLSGSFLSSHSKSSLHRQPCFLLCTIGQFACTYDPSLGKWLTLLKPTSPGASVVASTGSLFCLGNQVAECRVLSVCNPITRSLRHLPAMYKLRLIHKITMFEDRRTNAYTIVVAGEDGLPTPNPHSFNLITEVFDSCSNAWRAAEDPPTEAKFGSDPGVWFKGCFYCLTELPYGIVRFCADKGVWEEVSVAMPRSLDVPSLVTVRNRLLMVGRCRPNSQSRASIAIRIWELVRSVKAMSKCGDNEDLDGVVLTKGYTGACCEYEWVEVIEMPSAIRSEFLAPLASYSPFVCAGVGSSIFITTHLSPKVLALDLSLSSTNSAQWSWLPQDPLFPEKRDFHLLGFPFEPRFDAFP